MLLSQRYRIAPAKGTSTPDSVGPKWYESNVFWGSFALAFGRVLTVVAAMLSGDNYSSLSSRLNKKCYRISQMSSIAYFRTSWFFVFPLAHWC